jgi:hypothetical protein
MDRVTNLHIGMGIILTSQADKDRRLLRTGMRIILSAQRMLCLLSVQALQWISTAGAADAAPPTQPAPDCPCLVALGMRTILSRPTGGMGGAGSSR